MSFNAAIPVVTDPMLKSQLQTKTNFQAMNNVFGQNHLPFTADAEFSGMHSVVTFREQTGDPTTSAIQTSLYTKQVGSLPQLFFRPNSNQTPIQMTNSNVKTGLQSTNPPKYLAQQYSFIALSFYSLWRIFIWYKCGGFIYVESNKYVNLRRCHLRFRCFYCWRIYRSHRISRSNSHR